MGGWRDSLMAMFTTYFDGSGSPDDTAALVVAGFIATSVQWIEFERNWKDTLQAFNVSSLHMKHFAHSRGEFTSWKGDEQKRRQFLGRLINIILIRVRHSFASAVIMPDFRSVDAKYHLSELIKPYALAGCTCVEKVKQWAKRSAVNPEEIAYIFEDGDKDKGDLMKRMEEDHKILPIFLKKDKSVAFQAADLLAYEHLLVNTQIFGKGQTPTFSELRQPLQQLSKTQDDKNADWGIHSLPLLETDAIKAGVPLRQLASSQ
jgi:hypothetical protein